MCKGESPEDEKFGKSATYFDPSQCREGVKVTCRWCSTFGIVIVIVSKGIHFRSDTNKIEAEGLSFYYPRLLHCLNQMLAMILLSQHRVFSFKTVRPRAPCGARCIGHAVRTCSTVCLEAPHFKFGEGARPHLCMDEWNCPTSVLRRLGLTQAAWDIPTGLAPISGTKARSLEALSQYFAFH